MKNKEAKFKRQSRTIYSLMQKYSNHLVNIRTYYNFDSYIDMYMLYKTKLKDQTNHVKMVIQDKMGMPPF